MDLVEPRHDKTNKMRVHPAKTRICLCIRPVLSESSLSARRNLGSLAFHWAHCEDSDQTGWMPRLICVFAGRTLILLVLSCRGSVKDGRTTIFCFISRIISAFMPFSRTVFSPRTSTIYEGHPINNATHVVIFRQLTYISIMYIFWTIRTVTQTMNPA